MADITKLKVGVYDQDYFSGAQVSIFVGDVLVDEVTSLAFQIQQSRTPIFGYASETFDDVTKGNVIIQGEFSINFKEAGYMFLILDRYKRLVKGGESLLTPMSPGVTTKDGTVLQEYLNRFNIEQVTNKTTQSLRDKGLKTKEIVANAQSQALGFSSLGRALATSGQGMDAAENIMESFENVVWGKAADANVTQNRRADISTLNPFDIYITYGDYTGDDTIHHTIQKLESVYIIGTSKQIVIDGSPIQENYQFICKNLI